MKTNEKRLILVSLALAAGLGGLLLSRHLGDWRRSQQQREERLRLARTEADALLAEATLWKARGAWLDSHQPAMKSDLDADNILFESLLVKAQSAGVEVVTKQYQEPVKTERYHQAGVTLTVKGELPSVFQWIWSVQAPAEFCVVPLMTVKPDKDDPAKITCAIQFWRWYQPGPAAKSAA